MGKKVCVYVQSGNLGVISKFICLVFVLAKTKNVLRVRAKVNDVDCVGP